jgi:hypothetical protein
LEFANSIPPFFETTPLSHNTFGLCCGVWGVDCALPQVYNVLVVMAPYKGFAKKQWKRRKINRESNLPS